MKAKSPFGYSPQRVTIAEVDEIHDSAVKNQNQEMLAWSYLMREVINIRQLLEQQNTPPYDSGDSRRDRANDKGLSHQQENLSVSFGFSCRKYNQIIIFQSEQALKCALESNPDMMPVIGEDDYSGKLFPGLYIGAIKAS